ncbi:MAG: antibiotic biosynthesis monooxygenase [Cyclobacteriaceae bacterium]
MIVRHWKGTTSKTTAAPYLQHLEEDTFQILNQIDGFIDAKALRKDKVDGVEFVVISTWDSMEAVKKFAGENPALAVVPDKAKEYLQSFDEHVDHYEVVLKA